MSTENLTESHHRCPLGPGQGQVRRGDRGSFIPSCQAGARRQSLSLSPIFTRKEKSSESSFPSTFLYLLWPSRSRNSPPHWLVLMRLWYRGHPTVILLPWQCLLNPTQMTLGTKSSPYCVPVSLAIPTPDVTRSFTSSPSAVTPKCPSLTSASPLSFRPAFLPFENIWTTYPHRKLNVSQISLTYSMRRTDIAFFLLSKLGSNFGVTFDSPPFYDM